MEQQQLDSILRRIISGKLYGIVKYQYQDYSVVITDPNLDTLIQADWKYTHLYNELQQRKECLTLEQSYELLEEQGIWSKAKQQEMDKIQKDISSLQEKLLASRFLKQQQTTFRTAIEDAKKRLINLFNIKNQLWSSTIEFFADRAQKRFILEKSTKVDPDSLLSIQPFIDTLIVYYYTDSAISDKIIREVARSDRWRLYWTVAKNTGSPLFGKPAVETTDLQSSLITWTQKYDFAYQSNNRPPENIINDDDQFDAWYRHEAESIYNSLVKNYNEAKVEGVGGQEVFIPADSEGAKEIFAMNSKMDQSTIKQRTKAIKEKGVVQESDLPDVRRNIVTEANKLRSQEILNRSK